jgi:predicted nuclease of predicted toxin-antitoxin system
VRLLLDQGLPRSAATLLTEQGFDTVHAGDVGLASASDAAIIDRARIEGRTIVTLDADFHALIALAGASSPSVIRVREEGLKGGVLAELVAKTIGLCREELASGSVVTVRGGSIRVRALPLVTRFRQDESKP